MAIWILKWNDNNTHECKEPYVGADEVVRKIVVRADNEAGARKIAEQYGWDETNRYADEKLGNLSGFWLDARTSICEEIDPSGPPRFYLYDAISFTD